jgi:hypothetical protein
MSPGRANDSAMSRRGPKCRGAPASAGNGIGAAHHLTALVFRMDKQGTATGAQRSEHRKQCRCFMTATPTSESHHPRGVASVEQRLHLETRSVRTCERHLQRVSAVSATGTESEAEKQDRGAVRDWLRSGDEVKGADAAESRSWRTAKSSREDSLRCLAWQISGGPDAQERAS